MVNGEFVMKPNEPNPVNEIIITIINNNLKSINCISKPLKKKEEVQQS